ncbi:hypothetical protein [Nocardioides sp. B-3]|uniref:hypothetical protein n=1 Tax=Nocardioides sp. B-3 TaxID=2895565 RepID=UPI0021525210|nr:hypothetical protein [Nocardioides sp. B-3]UUZ61371.1 hypothetical protein LP418_12800 [Nocardioides sp. B-3]
MAKNVTKSRVRLPGVSSRAWEHPADRGALVALRKLKGFDTVLKTLSGLINERQWRLLLLGSAVRVDERQFPVLNRLLGDVGATPGRGRAAGALRPRQSRLPGPRRSG